MIVYHVCGMKKLLNYYKNGFIPGQVNGWKSVESAERFSLQTGRPIILRLKFNDKDVKTLEGHRGEAVYVPYSLDIKNIIGYAGCRQPANRSVKDSYKPRPSGRGS